MVFFHIHTYMSLTQNQANFIFYQWNPFLPKWTLLQKVLRKKRICLILKSIINSNKYCQPSQQKRMLGQWITTSMKGFWYPFFHIPGILLAQEHFKPQPNKVILSSFPKCGTTWLKALAFSITTWSCESETTNLLLTRLSHDCVPFIEFQISSSQPKLI